MNIGLIGAGMMGSTLGRLWASAGHAVLFSSRNPDALADLAKGIPGARTGTVAEAVAFADAVFLGIPYGAMPDLARAIAAGVTGKLVLDAGNIIPSRDGAIVEEIKKLGTGSGGYTQSLLPGAHVVKAYNTVYFKTLQTRTSQAAPTVGVPLAGDDEAALQKAAGLVRDSGFEPVILPGGIAASARLDYGNPVWNSNMGPADLKRALGILAS